MLLWHVFMCMAVTSSPLSDATRGVQDCAVASVLCDRLTDESKGSGGSGRWMSCCNGAQPPVCSTVSGCPSNQIRWSFTKEPLSVPVKLMLMRSWSGVCTYWKISKGQKGKRLKGHFPWIYSQMQNLWKAAPPCCWSRTFCLRHKFIFLSLLLPLILWMNFPGNKKSLCVLWVIIFKF